MTIGECAPIVPTGEMLNRPRYSIPSRVLDQRLYQWHLVTRVVVTTGCAIRRACKGHLLLEGACRGEAHQVDDLFVVHVDGAPGNVQCDAPSPAFIVMLCQTLLGCWQDSAGSFMCSIPRNSIPQMARSPYHPFSVSSCDVSPSQHT